MTEFVTFSGAGAISNLMVPIATSACSSLIAGTQSIYGQVDGGVDVARSCSADPVAAGSQLTWSSGAVWTVSAAGVANTDGFVVDAFDPVVGGMLFSTVVSSTIILYLCARSAGTILNFIRGH